MNPADSWKQWLAENGPRLLVFARSWGNSQHDAEDLLQEADTHPEVDIHQEVEVEADTHQAVDIQEAVHHHQTMVDQVIHHRMDHNLPHPHPLHRDIPLHHPPPTVHYHQFLNCKSTFMVVILLKSFKLFNLLLIARLNVMLKLLTCLISWVESVLPLK